MDTAAPMFFVGLALVLIAHRVARVAGLLGPRGGPTSWAGMGALSATLVLLVYLAVWLLGWGFKEQYLDGGVALWHAGVMLLASLVLVLFLLRPLRRVAMIRGSGADQSYTPLTVGQRVACLVAAVLCFCVVFWLIDHLLADHDTAPWSWIAWLSLGRGCGFLAGIAAGVFATAAIDALDRIHAVPELSKAGAARAIIIAAGPALAIAVIYYLAVPGARQAIGLSDLKVAGVELTMNTATQSSTVSPGFVGQEVFWSQSNNLTGASEPFLLQAYNMTRTNDTDAQHLMALTYFQREAVYMSLMDHVYPPDPGNPNLTQANWLNSFSQQRKILAAQAGWMQCLGLYRTNYPFNGHVSQIVSPAIEALMMADQALMNPADPQVNFDAMTDTLNRMDQQVAKDLAAAVPEWWANMTYPQAFKICKAAQTTVALATSDWKPQASSIAAPYIAVFVANSLAGMGYPQSGLEVLKRWLRYAAGQGHALPTAFRDEALAEFANILSRESGFPKTAAERDWFGYIYREAAADLHVDFAREGYDCDSFQRDAAVHASDADSPLPARLRMEARDRIFTVVATVAGWWLHAAVDARSSQQQDAITAHEAAVARGLIASASRCATWEDDYPSQLRETRDSREAVALFEGGRTLSRWALDAEKSGQLNETDVAPVREQGRQALERALPMLHDLVGESTTSSNPLLRGEEQSPDLAGAALDPYLRMVQQEVLQLDTVSGH